MLRGTTLAICTVADPFIASGTKFEETDVMVSVKSSCCSWFASRGISISTETDVWPLGSVTVQGPPDQSSEVAVPGVAAIMMVISVAGVTDAFSETVSASPSLML